MTIGGQGTKWRKNIAENFNRLSRVHERYRRQTDGRATAYSEREREFTFAKMLHDRYRVFHHCILVPDFPTPHFIDPLNLLSTS